MTGFQSLPKLILGAPLMVGIGAASRRMLPCWEDARKVASEMPVKLQAMLEGEIAKGGPASAVAVCNEEGAKDGQGCLGKKPVGLFAGLAWATAILKLCLTSGERSSTGRF